MEMFPSSRMNLNTLQLLAQTAGLAIKEKLFSGNYGSQDFLLATAAENNSVGSLGSGPYSSELTPLIKPQSFWIIDKVMTPPQPGAGDSRKVTRPLFYYYQWRKFKPVEYVY